MTVQEDLQKAVACHQSSQLQDALGLYNKVLAVLPENTDALHLAGLVHHQLGDNDQAVDLIGKAVALRSDSALYLTNYAVVLNMLANYVAAETASEKASAIDAGNGMAWHCLGIAQLGLRKFAAAQKALTQAVAIDQENSEYLNNLGTACRNLNRNDQAVEHFRKAASLDTSYPNARSNLAEALLSIGDMAEAAAVCQDVIQQFPDHATSYLTLGRVLLNRSEHSQAIANFERYLELRPEGINGYTALAGVQNILGDFTGALATLEKAAAINPASGDVRQMLGSLHLQLGDADKARENLTETVRLNPDNSKAFYEMSQLPGVDLTSQQLEHLREMVSREDLSEASKSEAAYTLARCAEKIKDYAGAFANLATANKLRLSLLENFGYTFDASAQAIEIQKTIDFFTAEFLAAQTRDESSAAPVFIIGLPRSGTTLIERIISSHTEAAGLGELTEIEKIVSTLKSQNPAYPECLSDIKTDELRQLGGGYLSFLQDKAPGARRIVDKNPFNFIHLGLIKSLFPKAAIIYCRRDLRDVGLSCFMQNFVDPLPWSNDLELMGQYFNQFGKLMDHWQQVLGEEILTLDYEKVVVDFESHARSIISHIGLAWDEKCLAFHEADGGVQTASTVQVREPIYQRSVGRWRNYEAQLNPLIEILD